MSRVWDKRDEVKEFLESLKRVFPNEFSIYKESEQKGWLVKGRLRK